MSLRDVITIKICYFRIKRKSKNQWHQNNKHFFVFTMQENQKHLYSLNTKNWLIVYCMPTNTKKVLWRYPFFINYAYTFSGKIRL